MNVYSERKQLYNLSRCIRKDRALPGEIIVKSPPCGKNMPIIVALVTQFAPGPPTEINPLSGKYIEASTDYHFVDGLMKDTFEERFLNFKRCIKQLTVFALGHPTMKTILVPAGLGCSGKPTAEWKSRYLPCLQNMASRLKSSNIEVIIFGTPFQQQEIESQSSEVRRSLSQDCRWSDLRKPASPPTLDIAATRRNNAIVLLYTYMYRMLNSPFML